MSDKTTTATQAKKRGNVARRGFMKGVGAAVATGIGVSASSRKAAAVDWDLIGKIGKTTVLGGPIELVWLLRENYDLLGADEAPTGLSAESLSHEAMKIAKTRESNNDSTFVDNRNIIEASEDTAYTKAKVAAIEALNNGLTKSKVKSAATDVVDQYYSTILSNLLKSWNETIREFDTLMQSLSDHSSIDPYNGDTTYTDFHVFNSTNNRYPASNFSTNTKTISLPDGSSMDVETAVITDANDYKPEWGPTSFIDMENSRSEYVNGQHELRLVHPNNSPTRLLEAPEWHNLTGDVETQHTNVRDGILLWVESVYGDVQSGEIEISNLITPAERAAMIDNDDGTAQPIADLLALNIPLDTGRKVTITIPSRDATVSGTLGLTDPTNDGPIEVNTQYDPSNFSGDAYLTYDVTTLEGVWSDYNSGVDGGIVTFTAEPFGGVEYVLYTEDDETATVTKTDFQGYDSSDNEVVDSEATYWEADVTSQLENAITSIYKVEYGSPETETRYETVQLSDPFVVDKIVNRETGESQTQLQFTQATPQDDSNYITQEEWDELAKQNEELIDKYDSSSGGGGGILAGTSFSQNEKLGIVAGGAAIAALLLGGN